MHINQISMEHHAVVTTSNSTDLDGKIVYATAGKQLQATKQGKLRIKR